MKQFLSPRIFYWAVKAAEVLGITLSVRNSTGAGFPYHALDTYLPKLIRAGVRVAICDQLEEPKGHAKISEIVEPSQKELFTQAWTIPFKRGIF